MTVHVSHDGTLRLEGNCPIEDAETLHRHLLANPQSSVDWRACDAAHTAVVQILLAARPVLRGPPRGDFLRQHIEPLLSASPGKVPPGGVEE